MARKKTANAAASDDVFRSATAPAAVAPTSRKRDLIPVSTSNGPLPSLEGKSLPTVHVNKSSIAELKNGCDDAVKRILNNLEFKEQHTYTDIRLALGYLGVLIAAAVTGYSYRYGFEETKGVVTIGVIAYFIISGIQVLYAYYVEGHKIYLGKRRLLSKRIETELIRVSSTTIPSTPKSPPLYSLTLSYRRSANNNKSLIRKQAEVISVAYGEIVDDAGGIEEARLEDWVGEVVVRMVGEEISPGTAVSSPVLS